MHPFQSNMRNLSQKNFRQQGDQQSQHGNLIEDLRQREKVYLDVICDLTNRNRQLEQQTRMYEQHCQMLEEELRKRQGMNNVNASRNRSSSSEKNLFRVFSGKLPEVEPQRQQIDVLRKEIEQVDETPELANNSSRFVQRMALILDSNFGEGNKKEPERMEEIQEIASTTKTDSIKSEEGNGGRAVESIKLIQGDGPLDFSSKNTQIRNVYTVEKEANERPPLHSPFLKTSYRPLQLQLSSNYISNSNGSGQTSRMVKDGLDPPTVRQSNLHSFHRPTVVEEKENQPRQSVHSIFAQPGTVKATLQPQIYRASNRSLTHKQYLKHPTEGLGLSSSNSYHTSSHASLTSYQPSNSNSQLRIGSHY